MVIVTERAPFERDELSFEAFYRAEYASVVRLAFALVGRREVAEEIAQEGFLACHQRWAAVSSYDSPAAWVRRVVTNRCVSSGRRHLTQLRVIARLRRERGVDLELAADTEQIWALVRGLPKRQAQTLALAFAEDLSVHQIAETLGIGEESVRTHLRRGRATLAEKLKEMSLDG